LLIKEINEPLHYTLETRL